MCDVHVYIDICNFKQSKSFLNLKEFFVWDISTENESDTPLSTFHLTLPFVLIWKWKLISSPNEYSDILYKTTLVVYHPFLVTS